MVIESAHKVEKQDKSNPGPRIVIAKLFNYKNNQYILKNTYHLKELFPKCEDFSQGAIVIHRSL